MLSIRRGCFITVRPQLLDSRRIVIGGPIARMVMVMWLRSRSLPQPSGPSFINTIVVDLSQFADETDDGLFGALQPGLGVAGVDGAHGAGQIDGNDEVVVGKGGHVVLLLDELV